MTGINSEAYIAPYRDQALSLSLSLTPNTYWQRYIALGSSYLTQFVWRPVLPQGASAKRRPTWPRQTDTGWHMSQPCLDHTKYCNTSLTLILSPHSCHASTPRILECSLGRVNQALPPTLHWGPCYPNTWHVTNYLTRGLYCPSLWEGNNSS